MAAPEAPLCYVGVSRDSAAFRLMKQMGWEEGNGIGKDNQGIKGYLKIKHKQDTTGVGVDDSVNRWAFDTSTFDEMLKRLNVQATEGDCVKKETVDKADNKLKSARPHRYKKREKAKLVSSYSANDLREILGGDPEAEDDPCRDTQTEVLSEAFQLCDEDAEGSNECGKTVSYPSEWWGHKLGFVSGGFLGSKSASKPRRPSTNNLEGRRTTFGEQDQENLYNLVQEKATSGKQGLGIKDRPKKISGCLWEGKKKSFDDRNDDGSSDSSLSNPGKRKAIELEETDPKPKLKKLCKRILAEVPGKSLRVRELKKILQSKSEAIFTTIPEGHDPVSYLSKKLQGSRKFKLEGKRVTLVTKQLS